jgi:hypothetical protein
MSTENEHVPKSPKISNGLAAMGWVTVGAAEGNGDEYG